MDKSKKGYLKFNRAELTEDKARQSKGQDLVVSRNFLVDLLNNSAKLNRIRILCEENGENDLAKEISKIIREKL